MAWGWMPLFNANVMPDTSGDAFFQPYDNLSLSVNRRHNVLVLADTATRIGIDGAGIVPDLETAITGATLSVLWSTVPTSGNFVIDFDYRTIATGEDTDPATFLRTLSTTVTPQATTRYLQTSEITLTAADFAPLRLVEFFFARDGVTEAGGGIAASVVVHQAGIRFTG